MVTTRVSKKKTRREKHSCEKKWSYIKTLNKSTDLPAVIEKGKGVSVLTCSSLPLWTSGGKKKYSASFKRQPVCPRNPLPTKGHLEVTLETQHVQLSIFIKLQALEVDLRAWLERNSSGKKFLNLFLSSLNLLSSPSTLAHEMRKMTEYCSTNIWSIVHVSHYNEGGS